MDCYGLSTAAAVFHAYASLQLLCVCFLLFVCVHLCFFLFSIIISCQSLKSLKLLEFQYAS